MHFDKINRKITLKAENLGKKYFGKKIFSSMDFSCENGDALGILGPNGSGKSTVAQIATGLISPSSGTFEIEFDGEKLSKDERKNFVGIAAPYLRLYDEFDALEHIRLILGMRGMTFDHDFAISMLEEFQLKTALRKDIRAFSTGMYQRMRLLNAVVHRPKVLVLDEPTSNLDSDGEKLVFDIIKTFVASGGIVLLATNSEKEASLTNKKLNLIDYKNKRKK